MRTEAPTPPHVATPSRSVPDTPSFLAFANIFLKRLKLMVALPLALAVAAAFVSLLLPPLYRATVSFVPETRSEAGNLPGGFAALATQFGLPLPSSANSPRFYSDVLRSRTLITEVLNSYFQDPRSKAIHDSATLVNILEVRGDSEAERLESGGRALSDAMDIAVGVETGIVRFSVETRYPELSAAVADHFATLLERFNSQTRQSNARERRVFVEGRVSEAERELHDAEESLKRFLEANRQFEGSPELQFQYDRLQRQVTIKHEVLTTLRRQYEEARIQEVNDTPVLTVIDTAVPPQRKSAPRRILIVLVAGLVGILIAVVIALFREYLDYARRVQDDEYHELASQWVAIRTELRALLSPGSRRRG